MSAVIKLVSSDAQLAQLVARARACACVDRVARCALEPRAARRPQPDVLSSICGVSTAVASGSWRRSSGSIPTTGVLLVVPQLDPALMLEAMRAGVNEFVAEPLSVPELQAAIKRLARAVRRRSSRGDVFAFVGAKGGVGATTVAVNVATALAKADPGLDAADRSERGVRRRGRVSGRRAALLGDGCARERPAARRRVLRRARRAQQVGPRPARRVRAARTGALRCGADSRRCSTSPARRDGTRCWTCRDPTRPRSSPSRWRRRSCSSRTRSWRRSATRAAWPPRCGSGTARTALQPGADADRRARRNRPRRCRAHRGDRRAPRVSERLPAGAAGDEQGPAGRARQSATSCRRRSPRSRATWRASPKRRRHESARTGSVFGRLSPAARPDLQQRWRSDVYTFDCVD